MAGFQSSIGRNFTTVSFPEVPHDNAPPLFDTVFEDADCGMAILNVGHDSTPVIVDANRTLEEWLATNRRSMVNFPFLQLFDPVADADGVRGFQQAFAVYGEAHGDFHMTLEEGHVVPVHVTLKPVTAATARQSAGVRERYVAVMRRSDDVHLLTLRQTSEARMNAENTRDRFLARLSHDLRTPLNGILGFADAIGQEVLGPLGQGQYREYVENILTAGRDLLEKVDDLLVQSAAHNGQIRIERQSHDAVLLASACVARARPAATAAKVALICQAAPDLPPLQADGDAVSRALDSVLDNAVKASPAMSRVMLLVEPGVGGGVEFQIHDSGAPVHPKQVTAEIEREGDGDKVFQTTFERRVAGLPLAWAVMQLHDGAMKFDQRETRKTIRRLTSIIRLCFG